MPFSGSLPTFYISIYIVKCRLKVSCGCNLEFYAGYDLQATENRIPPETPSWNHKLIIYIYMYILFVKMYALFVENKQN